jgi:hypothetical protein
MVNGGLKMVIYLKLNINIHMGQQDFLRQLTEHFSLGVPEFD